MYEIIVIGAGPAGISMAVESRVFGIDKDKVLVLEKSSEHSFSIRKFYPEKKLVTANYKGFEAVCTGTLCIPDLTKPETISYLDKAILDHQIRVNYNETVWKIHQHSTDEILRDGTPTGFTIYTDKGQYDTKIIAIAIGILGKPNKPDYKLPLSLKDRTLFEITSTQIHDSKVLVVGGGDSASEYCQYLLQENNNVTLSYRRSNFSRMNPINHQSLLALMESGAIRVLMNSNAVAVEDYEGRPLVKFAEEQTGEEVFDYVVFALGGTTPHNFLKTIGIEFDGDEPVLKAGYETSVPGMFLLGDLSAGQRGGSIIWAFNSANTAMHRICEKYLTK